MEELKKHINELGAVHTDLGFDGVADSLSKLRQEIDKFDESQIYSQEERA